MIYLDAAASIFGNPHSIHKEGLQLAKIIKKAEKQVLDHINGHNGKIYWTNNGSMANYWALHSLEHAFSPYEHKSAKLASAYPLPANRLVDYEDSLAYMLVNNETGEIFNLPEIHNKYRPRSLHTDAVAALGKIKIDVEKLKCNSLSLSGHKVGVPGVGVLWVRSNHNVCIPYLGTPNVGAIQSFGNIVANMDIDNANMHYQFLRTIFLDTLKSYIDENQKFFLNKGSGKHIPGIINISFPGVDRDELQFALSDKDVMVGTGSACGEGDSYVLEAMGFSQDRIKSAIRISFCPQTLISECQEATQIIASTIKELK